MNYFERHARDRINYWSAARELAWRSYARVRGWLDYDDYALPWHWPFSRAAYHLYYRFIHRGEKVPSFNVLPSRSILRHADEYGKGMWTYSRELRDDEPPSHAITIDLFTLEKKWGKKIILVGWIGSRVAPSTWPAYLDYNDYVLTGEEGVRNSRADDLPGWEHIEYTKMILIRKGQ